MQLSRRSIPLDVLERRRRMRTYIPLRIQQGALTKRHAARAVHQASLARQFTLGRLHE